jgi:hypothetical protein
MLLEYAIKQLLQDAPCVASAVGNRIFPGIAPQSAVYPLIAYRSPDGTNRVSEAVLDNDIQLVREYTRVYSSSQGLGKYMEVAALDDCIYEVLNKFNGTVTNPNLNPVDSLTIQSIFATERTHLYIGYDDRYQTHHFMSEFEIYYEFEATPTTMPIVGTTPTSGFQDEDLSAFAGGGNTIFTLQLEPVPGSLAVYVNGLLQSDFVATGLTVQLGIPPSFGDKVIFHYFA